MATTLGSSDELIELAAVVRAHGLRGELSLKPFNPDSDLLRDVKQVVLKLRSGETAVYTVVGSRGHSGQLLLALQGVTSREAAETLRGSVVCVPRSALPVLGEDEYYLIDLVGLDVRDRDGNALGRVEEIIQYPSVSCLLVSGERGSWEVPDTDRYIAEVDFEARCVTLDHVNELEILHVGPDKERG